ncbi:unnamed protein product [Schistocephalus solidus]|uniref:Uncharacterized protein n=1 Tax=Schistocephalus solidus TaxID=70667 RepID=A0A183SF33_SCHSO|nr:unnamed protein product [Schistocephalus solidus]
MSITPTTDNHLRDAPPPTITDIFHPPPCLAPITATNTTYPTRTTSVATSDFLPPATFTTTTNSVPAMARHRFNYFSYRLKSSNRTLRCYQTRDQSMKLGHFHWSVVSDIGAISATWLPLVVETGGFENRPISGIRFSLRMSPVSEAFSGIEQDDSARSAAVAGSTHLMTVVRHQTPTRYFLLELLRPESLLIANKGFPVHNLRRSLGSTIPDFLAAHCFSLEISPSICLILGCLSAPPLLSMALIARSTFATACAPKIRYGIGGHPRSSPTILTTSQHKCTANVRKTRELEATSISLTEFLLHTPYPGNSPHEMASEGVTSAEGLSRLRRTHAQDSSSDPPSKRSRGNEVSNLSSHLASVSFTPSDSELEAPLSPGFTILDLTEEEQLQMALQASAAETAGCSSSCDSVSNPSTSAAATCVPCSPRSTALAKGRVEMEAVRQRRMDCLGRVTSATSVETNPDHSLPADDCVIVSVDLNTAATAPSSSASLTTSSFQLPKPPNSAQALRIALRLPSGVRKVLELDPDMRLSVRPLLSTLMVNPSGIRVCAMSLCGPIHDYVSLIFPPTPRFATPASSQTTPSSSRKDSATLVPSPPLTGANASLLQISLSQPYLRQSAGAHILQPLYSQIPVKQPFGMSASQGFVKTVMVMMESVVSGHKLVAFRPRLMTQRKEMIAFDPVVQRNVLYREARKIRTLRKAGSRD